MDGDERIEGIERVDGLKREDSRNNLLAAFKDVDTIIDDEAMVREAMVVVRKEGLKTRDPDAHFE